MIKTGRPLKYKTAKELEKAIDAYFTSCVPTLMRDEDGNICFDKNDKPITVLNPPTVAGLALNLGFEDRRSLYDYKERPEFSHIIKKAILKIENYAEVQLMTGTSATGAIFWLKNHGWTDKTIQDVNLGGYSLFEQKVEEKAKKYAVKHTNRNKKRNEK